MSELDETGSNCFLLVVGGSAGRDGPSPEVVDFSGDFVSCFPLLDFRPKPMIEREKGMRGKAKGDCNYSRSIYDKK